MTRRTNARLAGLAFLAYIVAGLVSLRLPDGAPLADGLTLVTSLCALTLGVTLYALTAPVDADLALLALGCRFVEAIPSTGQAAAAFFAVASTIFCWLFLRGRMIPVALAWLGLVGSAGLTIITTLQESGVTGNVAGDWGSTLTWVIWMPVAVFEVVLAFWLILRGVNPVAEARGRRAA